MSSKTFLRFFLVGIVAGPALHLDAFAQSGPNKDAATLGQAKRAYEEGVAAYRLGQFEEATQRFEEAYRLAHSASILFDLAQSYRRLFETRKDGAAGKHAVELYRTYMRDGQASSDRISVAEGHVKDLERALQSESTRERLERMARAEGREGLRLAEELASEGAFMEALATVERVLSRPRNKRDVHLLALEKQAVYAARTRDANKATEALRKLLALDPGFAVPPGAEEKLKTAYEQAKRDGQGRALRIRLTPPAQASRTESTRMALFLDSDPLKMVTQFELRYRAAREREFARLRFSGHARSIELPVAAVATLPDGAHVEYVLVALDVLETELMTLGSEAEPLSLPVAPHASRVEAAESPWYKKWWVWAIVGGVVAGGTTAALLATQSSPNNPPPVLIPTP